MHISSPNLKPDYTQNFEGARFSSFTGLDARKEAFVEQYNLSQTGPSAQQHEVFRSKQVFQEPALQGAIYDTAAYGQQPYQPLMRQPEMWQQPTMFEQHSQQEFQFSETDFEAAFQDAFKHAEGLAQTEQQPEREMYNSNGVEIDVPQERQLPIGSDAINYVEQVDRTQDQDTKDADELARTAGQLLDMVQHDTSDKMRDSQFLNLMRRIRDREVEVQNNDLQSTNTHTTTNTNIRSNDKGMTKTYMENETDFHSLHNKNNEAESSQNQNQETHQNTSQATAYDPNPGSFAFPDMDAVYDFTAQTESAHMRPVTPLGMEYSSQYSSHEDEYPRTQVQALHPGGRWYPEQKSPRLERASMQLENQRDDRMSGAVNAGVGVGLSGLMNVGSGPVGMAISADDFEGRYDESPALERRFAARP
jgi:hypothetical protein